MGQEATTVAVAEPALSFEFDSSQSLFEQLTKAQQTNSSSFNTNVQQQFPQSTSPPIDSMPPPAMVPQQIPQSMPEEPMHPMMAYQPTSVPPTMNAIARSREQSVEQLRFNREGIPISQVHQRHSSMPAYMEYSPAPSLALSHYEDYSNRGMSFEPLTPPQASIALGAEPAYIANEDTGLYTAIPDLGVSNHFNPLMQLPPSNIVGPQFSGVTRAFAPSNVYSVIEGSPTYKQRRRRSSLSAGVSTAVTATGGAPHNVHRPSDLRRSMSNSVAPVPEADESHNNSPQNLNHSFNGMPDQKQVLELSRHGTPLATVESSPIQQNMSLVHQDDLSNLTNGDFKDFTEAPLQHSQLARTAAPGVFRRARSATMMELGPYPQKSHSCPIPTCGRLFKRLEHLKRHVRTHTQERPYVCSLCNKAFSRSDNLAQHRRTHEQQQNGEPVSFSEEDLENEEDQLVALEEESPESEHAYLNMPTSTSDMPAPMASMSTGTNNMNGATMNGTAISTPHMIAAQNY